MGDIDLVVVPHQFVVQVVVESLESFVFIEIWEVGKALLESMFRSRGNVDPIVGMMRPIPVSLFERCVHVAIAIAVVVIAFATCSLLSIALVALVKLIPLSVLATM